MIEKNLTLKDLGYTPAFEAERNRLGWGEFPAARVIAEFRGAYRVKNERGEYLAKVTGKQMFSALSREDYPAVGDWVAIAELGAERAAIQGILPRASVIKRIYGDRSKIGGKGRVQVIAANIDVAFAIESAGRDYNLNRFERYFAIAENGHVKSVAVLNKTDLLSDEELEGMVRELHARFPGADIIPASTVREGGMDALAKYIKKGATYCFLGSSGVGKSSIINVLLGEGTIHTKTVSEYSGRGRHATTTRQMYVLPPGSPAAGGIVVDNPGIREVGVADAGKGIEKAFGEIAEWAKRCKYVDCTHVSEPGCKVLDAVRSGTISKKQYANYISLKKEAEFHEMNDVEKREKDRTFGKFVKRAKKDLKELE